MLSSLNFYPIGTGEEPDLWGKRGYKLFYKDNSGGKVEESLWVGKKGEAGRSVRRFAQWPRQETTGVQWRQIISGDGTHFRTDREAETCRALREVLKCNLNHRPSDSSGLWGEAPAQGRGCRAAARSWSLHPTHGTLLPYHTFASLPRG